MRNYQPSNVAPSQGVAIQLIEESRGTIAAFGKPV
jgi:hypothetical protein